MNSLIFAKGYGLFDVDDRHLLAEPAAEVHLNTPLFRVVKGNVLKRSRIEPPTEFIINAVEDIQVERGGDPLGVVIGRDEDRGRFFQVNAQEEYVLRSENSRRAPEELDAFFRREISQTGP